MKNFILLNGHGLPPILRIALPWLGLIGIYLFLVGPYLLDSSFWFDRDRDNALLQFNNFTYWAGSIEHGFGLPRWYPHGGGSPIGLSAMSWKPLLPHRFFGYAMALLTSIDYITIYKITLVLGLLISSLGWYIFLYGVFRNPFVSLVGTIPVVFGGFGTTIFHQEYILGHLDWIPWLLILARQVDTKPKLLILIAAIMGIAISCDYPHFLFYATGLFLLVRLLTSPQARTQVKNLWYTPRVRPILATSVLVIGLCASPLLYVGFNHNEYSSPIRGGDSPTYNTLKEYETNSLGSSVSFKRVAQYIRPAAHVDDDTFGLFVGRTVFVLGVFALILSFRTAWPAAASVLIFFWLLLGVYGYFPQILYLIKMPFSNVFRQWYHFFPYLNWSLAFLGSLGYFLIWKTQPIRKIGVTARKAALVLLPLLLLAENIQYFQLYESRFLEHERNGFSEVAHPNKEQYLDIINQDWTEWLAVQSNRKSWGVPAGTKLILFSSKGHWRIHQSCPRMFPKGSAYGMPTAFSRLSVKLNFTEGISGKIDNCLTPYNFGFPQLDLKELCGGDKCSDYYLDWDSLTQRIRINPDGFEYIPENPPQPIELIPVNPTMNWTLLETQTPSPKILNVDEDTFLGVVPQGRNSKLNFSLKPTFYEYALWIQMLTLIGVAVIIRSRIFGRPSHQPTI